MDSHVGHGVKPLAGGRVDQTEVSQFQTGQEILFDVADSIFYAAFFVGLADPAGGDGEAEVVGEVLISRVQDWRFADGASQHRRA